MIEKNKLTKALEENKGKLISLSELSKISGISALKIHKTVKELKKEGYNIKSFGVFGCKSEYSTDVISQEGIRELLNKDEYTIEYFDVIDSTNTYAKKIAESATDRTVIVADSQTNGRGRLGREFHSPKENGIYMSIILKKCCLPSDDCLITVAAATAVSRAIEKTLDIKTEIKWVNDIFVNKKKVCGILAEGAGENIIVGIGINVKSTRDFPEELKDIAGALEAETVHRNKLIASVLNEMSAVISDEFSDTLEYYRKKSMVLGKTVTYEKNGCSYKGKVTEINDSGNLVIEDEKGEISVVCSGEIRLKVSDIS